MSQAMPKTMMEPSARPLPRSKERQKLLALVSDWRAGTSAVTSDRQDSSPLPAWGALLDRLGFGQRQPGWAAALSRDSKKTEELRHFLAQADSQTAELAKTEVTQALLDELEQFSRGLSFNPASDRLLLTFQSPQLEELYTLVGGEGFSDELEAALQGFDQQVLARRDSVKSRLEWKPSRNQDRVDATVSQTCYRTGEPSWWSGRLNNAPAILGRKLESEKAEQVVIELEKSLHKYFNAEQVPKSKWADVRLDNTYFSQGLEPRVQFGELKDAPGVEGYLKGAPQGGPRVLEFPLEDGSFAYLMFDGHHRAAAQILTGARRFEKVTVMRLDETQERYGLSEQDILDAIRDLHTHLYMTDTPVPR